MEEKKTKKKKKASKKSELEFCKVCRFHHDQGPRHKYFPRHKELLSAFLNRFRSKVTDVRFFLKNPSFLRPQEESQNRVWCVFCDEDIVELGSSFACSKAINHLASSEHHKNIKQFLWKHGPSMDCVDDFKISDADVAKWVRKCTALGNKDASSCKGQLSGTSSDILNNVELERTEKVQTNYINPNDLNDVTPLLYNTNEYQISHSGIPGVTHYGSRLNVDASHLPSGVVGMTSTSSSHSSDSIGNVHSGAPPPWLNPNDANIFSGQLNQLDITRVQEKMPVKTSKLNPHRVGAAWAERRKLEMEMEKRGLASSSNPDPDWLPNFGRVWQSGTRKDSRKEFEKEKRKLVVKPESRTTESKERKLFQTESISMESEEPVIIQPYVSKRARREKNGE
ncbi:TITAN-like protein [Hirschfeldia incana]|nr:TITAN-like protein [Hirschfeldia incana]